MGRLVVLSTKVTQVERAAIQEAARDAGMTPAAFVRDCLGPVIRRRLAGTATATTARRPRRPALSATDPAHVSSAD